MDRPEWTPLLERTCELALEFLGRLPERRVAPAHTPKDALAAFAGPLPEAGSEPHAVLEALVERADPGLCAMPSGRFFGWVIGGGLPAAVAADWLTTVWDQNCGSAEEPRPPPPPSWSRSARSPSCSLCRPPPACW